MHYRSKHSSGQDHDWSLILSADKWKRTTAGAVSLRCWTDADGNPERGRSFHLSMSREELDALVQLSHGSFAFAAQHYAERANARHMVLLGKYVTAQDELTEAKHEAERLKAEIADLKKHRALGGAL